MKYIGFWSISRLYFHYKLR